MDTHANFTSFQYLLYYIASFFGLAPFGVEKNVLRPLGFRRKAYVAVLALLNTAWIFHVSYNIRPSQKVEITPITQLMTTMIAALFLGNIYSSLLTFSFKSGKLIEIWNRMIAISREVRKLRIDDDCGMSWKSVCIKCISSNGVFILVIIIIETSDYDIYNFRSTRSEILFWTGLIVSGTFRYNVLVIFATIIICIRKLFESLNERLENAVQPNCNFPSSDDRHGSAAYRVLRGRRIADLTARRIVTGTKDAPLDAEDVKEIAKLHQELCDLVEFVTRGFTVPILFNILQHFINILSNCYSIYTRVFASHEIYETTDSVVAYTFRPIVWASIDFMELLLIAHACTSMSRVANATKAVLHEFWNKFYPEELRDELVKFSLQILHKPIAVSLFGFFDLGYSFVYKIFCTFVAYMIIMIQLDTSTH